MDTEATYINAAYRHDKNAFKLGCGKDTMMYKFARVTGEYPSVYKIRRMLERNMVWLKKPGEYTKFFPKTVTEE